MNLRLSVRRIIHGAEHMPAHALILHTAVVMFGAGVTLTAPDPLFGFLTTVITAVAGTSTLWELYDAAIECEQEPDDVDQSETGFGTAA